MKPLCLWTGTRNERAVAIVLPSTDRFGAPNGTQTVHVLPEHIDELREFAVLTQRYARSFLIWILGLSLLLIPLAILAGMGAVSESLLLLCVGVITIATGALVYALPFATPETVGMFGVRRSIRILRILGVVLIVIGMAVGVGSAWV